MQPARSFSDLSPEQQAAGMRVWIAFAVALGLNVAGMLALFVVGVTTDIISSRTMITTLFPMALFDLVARRLLVAYMAKVETGVWPKRTIARWLWDGLLVTMLAVLLIFAWR
jgi:hypothetical protein